MKKRHITHGTNDKSLTGGWTRSIIPNRRKTVIIYKENRSYYFKYDICQESEKCWMLFNSNNVIRVEK